MKRTYKSESTVTFLRKLRPYRLHRSGHYEDPHVRDILQSSSDQDTLATLDLYTRGMYDIELHYNNFNAYIHPVSEEIELSKRFESSINFQAAYQLVRADLAQIHHVRPIPSDQIDQVKWIPSSAAGYTYIGKKRDNYTQARINASRALYEFRRYRNEYRFVPDKAYARSQLALKAEPKIRHVWGRSFHNVLIEGLTGQPLMEKLLLHDVPIYIGHDLHKDMPATIIKIMQADKSYCYCIDFSGFDSSLPNWLIDQAWTILRGLLQFNDRFEEDIFDFAENLFKNTPVIMPDGRLFMVQVGVPSGSLYTQLVDSICNLILIYAFQLEKFGTVCKTYVLGDDSVFASDILIPLDEISAFFQPYRMKVNVNKTIITRNYADIVFLGHNFYGSRVTRDELTCLSLALFTEEEVITPAQTIVRISSLLYDSGFNSFGLYFIYKSLLERYQIDWSQEENRPLDVQHPFTKLFVIS